MLTGTNLKYTKALNHRIVLETIRLHAPISRADIARNTSLTAQTISNIATELIDADLVHEAGKEQQGRGAPSTRLEINPEGAHSIGLDLDRDHLTGVLVDLSGSVRQRIHYELSFPPPGEAVDLMIATVHDLVEKHGVSVSDMSGIGVGFPGPVEIQTGDEGTTTANPRAFPGWDHVPIVDLLQEHIDLPIFLENNATAAAVGERWYGLGREASTFFYLLFGVGLGGGLVINGHPYEGNTGNAGEIGYIPRSQGGSLLNGTEPIHLGEHYHLPRLFDRLQEKGIDASTPADLACPLADGSPVLNDWLNTVAEKLAPLLVSIEYLIDPAILVFGGRLPGPLLEELIDRLKNRLQTLRTDVRPAVPSLQKASAGEDAAAMGVATLPIYDLFAPTPTLLFKSQQSSLSSDTRHPAGGGN
jgi:predicted NBD/HSP70 family sugar kinase